MHANHTDFQMEKVNNEQTKKRKNSEEDIVSQKNGQTVAKIRESESCVKKFKPIKVATPGTFVGQISVKVCQGLTYLFTLITFKSRSPCF